MGMHRNRNIGRDISHAVRDAMRTGNFENLGNTVRNTVRDVTADVEADVRDSMSGNHQKDQSAYPPPPYQKPSSNYPPYYRPYRSAKTRSEMIPGKVSGGVLLGTGLAVGIPCLVTAIVGSVMTGMGMIAASVFAVGGVVLYILSVVGAFLFGKGTSLLRRVRRYRKYRTLMQGTSFCSIKQLADGIHKTPEYVTKDLKKMISKRIFPDGHLDEQGTTFMLGDETYQSYLQAEKARKEREAEEERLRSDPAAAALAQAKAEGDQYIRAIREANDKIPEEEISRKLDRLEEVCKKIFDYVEEHPKKLPEIRRFMQYYLPTTLKLVNAYQEFDSQPMQGENILQAKKEIEQTMDTINTAFENLLDTLFQDDVLDVATDISALETMLAQAGLTGKDFKKEETQKEPELKL